ncbi:hypothetical protein IFM89_003325 [Coptis chinensis]|uniref:Uncharacterized protein n=1 Tax=Coptis chinensis TaxID=261450 RepID=A0A835ITF3_9MAGN|nr:hypothetical protein IFM89_003325 [Coptis chinensis]
MLKKEMSSCSGGGGGGGWPRACDSCHSAACAVYCRADSAYLCTGCDADIHSANPLSRRHQRVPLYGPSANYRSRPLGSIVDMESEFLGTEEANEELEEREDDETSSWLLLNPVKYPVLSVLVITLQQSCTNASIPVAVSMSSMDASIVPDSTMSDTSNMHSRTPKGTIDLFSSPPIQMPAQFSPMDREARVLRYREKRKTRKFEKTIRYASRKAYAETRPRIKGRFAKRTDLEAEVDQMFATSVMAESGYGIVPSF